MLINIDILFAVCAVLLTGISQTILKWATKHGKKINGIIGDYLNLPVLIAYVIFILVTVCSVLALRTMDLKFFYAFSSLNFVIILIFSAVFLKEKVNSRMILAVIIIILGIFVFNSDLPVLYSI
ncbi:EamA family transporter [Methanoplanus limicola]|uniref:Uncharacterized protein n=1 Tax=Methanoplanus limicola DSM 2279 TaxID=937775 RepID=H1Z1X1_9EURY|nr:EamA family transporter [Methanoplanus limicola]EHQ35438.1 protein of unknown function DUF6 transmembrane [Methanoplanus limicola DSM 2279]